MNVIPNSLHVSDMAHSMHPYTNMRAHEEEGPMIMVKGDGARVYDSEGKEYIEGMAGLWSVAVGFSEKRLRDAATAQLDALPYYHSFAQKANQPAILLAEKLADMAPAHLNRVFFTNSGSEANDTVIKMVWFMNNALGRPEKKKFLARNKAYHGITIASGSLTGLSGNHKDFDLPAIPVTHLTCPHYWREGQEGESEADFTARLLRELEDTILAEGPDTIAAFIGEPVMGAGGVIIPPEGYWPGVAEICKKYDILLIADEVINGFGRLGTRFGIERFGFAPDMLVLSKQLTSSYMPLAAILVSDAVYGAIADHTATLGTFGHGYTATGHPVSCAVGLENLAIIEEKGLIDHAARLEPHFIAGFQSFRDHPLVGEVRAIGLIGGIEIADKVTKEPFGKSGAVAARVSKAAAAHGLICRNVYNTIALCPPLIITEDDLTQIFDRLRAALDHVHNEMKTAGEI